MNSEEFGGYHQGGQQWQGGGFPPPPPLYPQGGQQPGAQQPGGFPTPGWGAPKPGIIPLRQLDLGSLYSGAFAAIKANPAVMIGLTAAIVVLTQIVTFLVQLPLTGVRFAEDADAGDIVSGIATTSASDAVAGIIPAFGTLLITGLLIVVVARAVLGERTGVGAAWAALRPRLLPFIGLALLQLLIVAIPILIGIAIAFAVGAGTGLVGLTVALAIALFIVVFVIYIALAPTFALAPSIVILERVGPIEAYRRAFEMQKRGYWRLLGILLLTSIIVGIVAGIVSIPFTVATVVTDMSGTDTALVGQSVLGVGLTAIGTAIGTIITLPFTSGVQTLLYIDQRFRTEPLLPMLHTEAGYRAQYGVPGMNVDDIWLAGRPPLRR